MANEREIRRQTIEKLKRMGQDHVKKLMGTAFISTGNFKDRNREDIARELGTDRHNKQMMDHIDYQLKRHDEREKNKKEGRDPKDCK